MQNTLPDLGFMPAYVIVGLGILYFFLFKGVPLFKKISPAVVFFIMLIGAFFSEYCLGSVNRSLFFNMVQIDSYSVLFNQIFYLTAGATVLMMWKSPEMSEDTKWESMGLLGTILLGMMFMASTKNLLMSVVAFELVSIPSYLFVGMNRINKVSKEAALKYVLFGAFSTGLMLYGMSLLFGLTGALDFTYIWGHLGEPTILGSPVYFLAILLTLGGMTFKVAAVPFHFWCPDAYQTAPTPITAFLSVAPKVAGFALIMRFLSGHLTTHTAHLTTILSVIAILTMTIGNLSALKQTDIKRLLAYSSIAHAGYLLMGVAVLTHEARQLVFFYIIIYMIMNLAAFMGIAYLSEGRKFQIDSFKGIVTQKPLLVVGLGICFFSLAGIPPFAGFIGKFYLFKIVIEKEMFLLAIIAGINSVISLYYYVNVLKVMIIDKSDQAISLPKWDRLPVGFVTLSAIPLLLFGVYWRPLLQWVDLMLPFK